MKIHDALAADHARLRALLQNAHADAMAYLEFRGGLLRHIAMEEKVLFLEARARNGGRPLAVMRQLHADHAAIASLLVPPPAETLLATLRNLLAEHDPLEEGPDGFYAQCESLIGADHIDAVLARMHAIPPVRVSQHVDEPRIHEHIARMLAARGRT